MNPERAINTFLPTISIKIAKPYRGLATKLKSIIDQQIPAESSLHILKTEHVKYPDTVELSRGPTDMAIVRHQADLHDVTTKGAIPQESVATQNIIYSKHKEFSFIIHIFRYFLYSAKLAEIHQTLSEIRNP